MNKITEDSIVDLVFQLKWKSSDASHSEMHLASNVNVWRDYLPSVLQQGLLGKKTSDQIQLDVEPGSLITDFDQTRVMQLKKNQFDLERFKPKQRTPPRSGRFYPQGILRGIPGIFSANIQPFRCVGVQNGSINVDLNHPLAGKKASLTATVGKVDSKKSERGGASIDWFAQLTDGPGMQARWQDTQTDYSSDNPFSRSDETPDHLFYQQPRFVDHLDQTAIGLVSDLYGRLLKNEMEVLDLMSSWHSHLPEHLNLGRVTGLGLNQKELDRNDRLDRRVVHDLNEQPNLPFKDSDFDAVICTASIEYLTDPQAIFQEIRRVLRPGGVSIVTFSNRWFPPKAIQIWQQMHEFERMGLVLDYFLNTDGFANLKTYSVRGLPRPADDKYYAQQPFADPVYAVWGYKL